MQVERDELEKLAAEQAPRWPSRKAAWFDGFRHGEMQARMTGQGRREDWLAYSEGTPAAPCLPNDDF